MIPHHARWIAALGVSIAAALGLSHIAHAQVAYQYQGGTQTAPAIPQTTICTNGTIAGNGADTTEDAMMACTLPASQLKNAGDRIHIVAGGLFAATTENKVLRVRLGGASGSVVSTLTVASTNNTRWQMDIWIVKTGASAQSSTASTVFTANGSTVVTGTWTQTDTNALQVLLTGQDTTAATANAIQAQYMSVDYVH